MALLSIVISASYATTSLLAAVALHVLCYVQGSFKKSDPYKH
jgi:hypothetical protein